MRRTLSLKRESLAVLSTDEMAGVAGGSHACGVTHTASFDVDCPTLPINVCVQEVRDCLASRSCFMTR